MLDFFHDLLFVLVKGRTAVGSVAGNTERYLNLLGRRLKVLHVLSPVSMAGLTLNVDQIHLLPLHRETSRLLVTRAMALDTTRIELFGSLHQCVISMGVIRGFPSCHLV